MKSSTWAARAKSLLRAEMKRKGVTYRGLAQRLNAMGLVEDERNLSNKVSRGAFSAAFFLQCLAALDVTTLHLD